MALKGTPQTLQIKLWSKTYQTIITFLLCHKHASFLFRRLTLPVTDDDFKAVHNHGLVCVIPVASPVFEVELQIENEHPRDRAKV